jgi:trimethylamine corrinoid protein
VDISSITENYYDAVLDTDRDEALHVIDEAINSGVEPETLVFDVVLPSLDGMLHAISRDDNATLSQHFISVKFAGEVVETLIARFKIKPTCSGTIVLGTAAGDFHGLGKKIVAGCLAAHMYTVHDAGLNVSPRRFVDLAEHNAADVIGVSSTMMHTTTGDNGPKGVRDELQRRGLEKHIRLIVGGAPYKFDEELYRKVSADGWAENALSAVSVIKAFTARGEHYA